MVGLVNDLLDISKIEENMVSLEHAPFRLSDLIDRVVQIGSVSIGAKPVVLSHEISPDLEAEYYGDSQRLHQVLLNLVSNAVKFTLEGSVKLQVRILDMGDREPALQFAVADTGIGMSGEAAARIFDKFVQADSSTTRRFGGTGLGLSIARSFAELMGGTLTVASTENVGSVFTFVVPLTAVKTPSLLPAAPSARRRTILLVDDNEANLLVARALLEEMEHTVITASNGAEAIEFARSSHIDLILMDIQMEGMDAYEATRRIRSEEAADQCPRRQIVALSAYDARSARAKCLAAGMDGYIAKPIDAANLAAAIEPSLHATTR